MTLIINSEDIVAELISSNIPELFVGAKQDLPYRVNITSECAREESYKVDVLIGEKKNGESKRSPFPLVVVEIKNYTKSQITTHAVITYSTKALKHKELFPHLGYGLLYISDKD